MRLGLTEAGGANIAAFLDMLAWSEIGAEMLTDPATDDGYKVIVGSKPGNLRLCSNYDDHPQEFVKVVFHHTDGTTTTVESSAAGRYQFLARTWDALARDMRFENFRPENQDRGAIELIRECGAITLLRSDDIEDAIAACAHIWASLPGNDYGQGGNTRRDLTAIYRTAQAKYRGA